MQARPPYPPGNEPTRIPSPERTARSASVCVIGAGRIAEEHLSYLRTSRRTRLLGICDLDGVLATRAAKQFGDAVAYTDHTAMLSDLRPEVIHVLTPVGSHLPLVSDAVSAGASLVVVEKPAGASLSDTEAMVRAAAQVGMRLTEDHNYRFNPPVSQLVAVVSSGVLGSVREVDVRMAMSLSGSRYSDAMEQQRAEQQVGGVLREFLPHLAYLGLLFNRSAKVTRVAWSKRDPSCSITPDDLDALLESSSDGPTVRLRFSSNVAPATTSITVRGTLGWAEADLQNPAVRVSRPRDVGDALSPLADQVVGGLSLVRASGRGFAAKLRGSAIYAGIGIFLDRTYKAFLEDDSLPVSHDDVLATARVIEQLAAAVRS